MFDEMTADGQTSFSLPCPCLSVYFTIPVLVPIPASKLQGQDELYVFVPLGQNERISTKPVSGTSKPSIFIAVVVIEVMFVGRRARTSTSWLRTPRPTATLLHISMLRQRAR